MKKQEPEHNDLEPQLLRMKEVMRLTTLSRRTIYKLISQNKFPKQVYPHANAPRFRRSQVMNWINTLPATKPRTKKKTDK